MDFTGLINTNLLKVISNISECVGIFPKQMETLSIRLYKGHNHSKVSEKFIIKKAITTNYFEFLC